MVSTVTTTYQSSTRAGQGRTERPVPKVPLTFGRHLQEGRLRRVGAAQHAVDLRSNEPHSPPTG